MNSSRFAEILQPKIPTHSLAYCIALWQEIPFSFQVTRERKTKLGDFRFRPDRKIQTITINGTLNPYQFLLTYIHEVAHLHTFDRFGRRILPHGKEWKNTFKTLLQPLLTETVFPRNILIPLRKHMANPKASSAGDLFLMKEMSKYDNSRENDSLEFLSDLKPGISFELSGRVFKKGETRRTRVLCEEIRTGKKFLIAQLAKVRALEKED